MNADPDSKPPEPLADRLLWAVLAWRLRHRVSSRVSLKRIVQVPSALRAIQNPDGSTIIWAGIALTDQEILRVARCILPRRTLVALEHELYHGPTERTIAWLATGAIAGLLGLSTVLTLTWMGVIGPSIRSPNESDQSPSIAQQSPPGRRRPLPTTTTLPPTTTTTTMAPVSTLPALTLPSASAPATTSSIAHGHATKRHGPFAGLPPGPPASVPPRQSHTSGRPFIALTALPLALLPVKRARRR